MAVKLDINQRIQLHSPTLDRNSKKYYPSRIEEKDADSLYIAEPLDGTVPVYIPIGQEIEVIFNDEKGTYLFKTKVLGRVERNIRLLRITMPEAVEKINRRDFFRLQVFIPFTFRVLSEEVYRYGFPEKQAAIKGTVLKPHVLKEEADKLEGIVKDISGGGALVAVSEKIDLKVGHHLEMWLPIAYEEEPVYLWADVVRILPNPDATRWNKDIGITFSKINERDRDNIISHILALQRALLQKGTMQADNDV